MFSLRAFHLWFTSHATTKAFRFSVKVSPFLRVFPQSCIKRCFPVHVFKLLGTYSSCELLSLTKGNRGMLVPKCNTDLGQCNELVSVLEAGGCVVPLLCLGLLRWVRKGCISPGVVLPLGYHVAFIEFVQGILLCEPK